MFFAKNDCIFARDVINKKTINMKRKITSLVSILFVASVCFAQVKVASNGNVGVGTTPTTTERLLVSDGALKIGNSSSSTERAKNMIKIGDGSYVQIGEWEADDMLSFKANRYNFTNGNVGIGLASGVSPARKLHVYGETLLDAYNTQNWGSAIKVKTYQANACAYHLTYNNTDVFYVCSQGYAWAKGNYYFGSDIAFKENVKQLEGSLSKILRLNGVTYQLKDRDKESGDEFQIGFIAQEVEKVIPEVVKTMHDGTKAMSYMNLTAVLVEAIKEQQTMIENLQQRIEQLEKSSATINTLKLLNTSETIATQELHLSNNVETTELKLYQNAPNPFNERTTIKCYVPQAIQKVQLCVYNMQGVQVQCLNITERGNVELQIEAGALSAGIYSYVLLADGAASETKQMILTK